MTSEILPDNVLNKIEMILTAVYEDYVHHKKYRDKYKRIHCVLYKLQLLFNTTSLACGSSTALTLMSGVFPGAIVLSSVAGASAGLGIFMQMMDKTVVKKIKKHHQLIALARNLDLNLFEKYLYDRQIHADELSQVMKMFYKYYESKDDITLKSVKALHSHILNENGKSNGIKSASTENTG